MSSEPAIAVRGVTKIYRLYRRPVHRLTEALLRHRRCYHVPVWAIREVSFDVAAGSTVGIVGRNGSGKSTLLQVVSGVLWPTYGEVEVCGRLAALLELGAGFNPEFTGRENALLAANLLGVKPRGLRYKVDAIRDFAELGDFFDRPVKTYSSGMYVRLAFATVAHVDADILIIDEALAVGDEKFQRRCYEHLDQLHQRGCTILFVSHDADAVERICDRAILLDEGRLVAHDRPAQVLEEYRRRLYSAEESYVAALNRPPAAVEPAGQAQPAPDEQPAAEDVGPVFSLDRPLQPGQGAKIEWAQMRNGAAQECYVFPSGDPAEIAFGVRFLADVTEAQAGIRIRTVQGVEVYGTSTAYHLRLQGIRRGELRVFRFRQPLTLCQNTYYLSIAVARRDGQADMTYLDKLSDVILFRVTEHPLRGSGLANLGSEIRIEEG